MDRGAPSLHHHLEVKQNEEILAILPLAIAIAIAIAIPVRPFYRS